MPLSKAHPCALLAPNARKGSESLLVCRSALSVAFAMQKLHLPAAGETTQGEET